LHQNLWGTLVLSFPPKQYFYKYFTISHCLKLTGERVKAT